jgi:hypothetical protein
MRVKSSSAYGILVNNSSASALTSRESCYLSDHFSLSWGASERIFCSFKNMQDYTTMSLTEAYEGRLVFEKHIL